MNWKIHHLQHMSDLAEINLPSLKAKKERMLSELVEKYKDAGNGFTEVQNTMEVLEFEDYLFSVLGENEFYRLSGIAFYRVINSLRSIQN